MALETSPESPAPVRAINQLMSGWVGRLGVVWVEGEAGFGKSALVAHLADASVGAWSVVQAHCAEVAGAPTGLVWADVLAALGGAPTGRSDAPFEVAERVRLPRRAVSR